MMMKVLKVSEITSSIDLIIRKKEEEKKHLLAIRDSIKKVIDLDDALKGEGGTAIREHFTVLHIPVCE
jgi:predicted ribonuclease toxin of YeeF-YezG toxin-antitoxin module